MGKNKPSKAASAAHQQAKGVRRKAGGFPYLSSAIAVALVATATYYWRGANSPSQVRTAADKSPSRAANTGTCEDMSVACPQWAREDGCEKNKKFMASTCPVTCGLCKAPQGKAKCVDDHADCERWALRGECYKNSEFMRLECQKSCGVCGPFGPACERVGKPAIAPGDMNAMFERSLTDFPQLLPTVLNKDPWVVRFDNFISSEEADHIIGLCSDTFQRSLAGDSVSPVRTSTQCWCNFAKCLKDPIMQRVEARIASVTGVPVENGEFMQIVRYHEGQFYKEHHDQNSATWSPQGVRVYTFFIYLNDVEEGGETSFSRLGLKVQPKKGAAILWPSVLNDAPNKTEERTYHAAEPVKKGMKYGANMWIHMHDFRTVSGMHCLFTMKNTVE